MRLARLPRLAFARPAWLPAPSLDGNPVLWREWWRARSTFGPRLFWFLYFLAAGAVTVLSVHEFWNGQRIPDLVGVVGYEVGIGLLAVAIRSSLAWSREKTAGREGLDLLLATPLAHHDDRDGKVVGRLSGRRADRVPAGRVGRDPGPGCRSTAGFAGNARGIRQDNRRGCYSGSGSPLRCRLGEPRAAAGDSTGPAGPGGVHDGRSVRRHHALSANSDRDGVSGVKPGPRWRARRRQPGCRTDRHPDLALFQSLFRNGEVHPAVRVRLGRPDRMLCLALNWWTIHRFDRWMGRIPSTAANKS